MNDNKNNIIGFIIINEKDLNKDIRILNSYDQYRKENPGFAKEGYENNNAKEIQSICEIKIDDILIPFSFYHKFQGCGQHKVEYIFKDYLTNSSCLFYQCKNLSSLDLSHFNADHITNMTLMFAGCESLTNVNFAGINTKKVRNMRHMFNGCESLKDLDLSNFRTDNVIDMVGMFERCISLTNLNLSNFNTQKVVSMVYMFCDCESLTDLDISNFNTLNVVDSGDMLDGCYSLKNIRLKDTSPESQSMEFMLGINMYWPTINSHLSNSNK